MLLLPSEKLNKLRLTSGDLLARCPAVIGKIIAPSMLNSAVNKTAKVDLRFTDAFRTMRHMKIENHACPSLLRPSKKAFTVPLNKSDGAVNQFSFTLTEIKTDRFHKVSERPSRHKK